MAGAPANAGPMEGRPKRRSVIVSGHRTSVSVEPAFWDELAAIAGRHDMSMNALVSAIDHARSGSLSAAIRLYVLDDVKSRAGPE
jgi:predicted DNA-binding ribbon-helix-helix protein